MRAQPLTFEPIYKEKIWGGRNLERLFGRELPGKQLIGESWELADLSNGVSVVAEGKLEGATLTELTADMGDALLGKAQPAPDGRFPLLLKLLDANDTLSLQVHPDAKAVAEIGGDAALKTECWYIVESRDGTIYKGVKQGVTSGRFREAIETETCEDVVVRFDVATGDFHYLPAGTVHALCAGLVVAEVQTSSDTTYRVTDWGRGRDIHVDRSMRCIHFEPAAEDIPGAAGETLLVTDFFTVARREVQAGSMFILPADRCTALMLLAADAPVRIGYDNDGGGVVTVRAGDSVLLPAALRGPRLKSDAAYSFLEITLPGA
ncbi:MAG: type I phosphomannose isomerase catalytic subunit [Planctomycetota bacterium]|jgi:mannose-6-phosphate isomerase